MGLLSIILNEIGLTLGWVYLFMGVVIGSAVIPVSMVLTWKKASAKGAIAGALLGQICAIIAWLVSADKTGRRWCHPSSQHNKYNRTSAHSTLWWFAWRSLSVTDDKSTPRNGTGLLRF